MDFVWYQYGCGTCHKLGVAGGGGGIPEWLHRQHQEEEEEEWRGGVACVGVVAAILCIKQVALSKFISHAT
jgi:hypothetical protein